MQENPLEIMQIGGTIAAVIYQNTENGYCVLRLDTAEGQVTAVGCIPAPAAGEELLLSGKWATHSSYGEQFAAETVERRLPSDKRAIFAYLSYGAVKGIGPALAAAIVNKFGSETLDIIESSPERLAEIKGISLKKALQIGGDYLRQSGLRSLMEFLTKNGLNPRFAIQLYKTYGSDAMDALKNNPYVLTHDLFGADFFEADEFALSLGFESDSPERVEAAILFELRHNLSNGHVFLPREKLLYATDELIGVGRDALEDALSMLTDAGYIVEEHVAGVDACYLEHMHEAESYVNHRIAKMADGMLENIKDVEKLVDEIELKQGIKYAEKQRQAVLYAAENQIIVLTGGPGTGKTTAVRGVLALFDSMGFETSLAAPTGRAAKRMSELTGREASTIHRLLGAGYADNSTDLSFERDESDPLEADAIILDETSMVDINLMHSLLRAMRSDTRLVLVGDADQLPSVGPGNVFGDIIRSGRVKTVFLTEIFRQSNESLIIKNAHAINSGAMPDLTQKKGDFFFMRRQNAQSTVETIISLHKTRLPDNMGIPPEQIQVLSPSRKGETGTINLNRRLQEALNPPDKSKREVKFGEFIFREGDRVMQIRNDYDIMWKKNDGTSGTGVFNGDIGKIAAIGDGNSTIAVEMDDKTVIYSFDMLTELEPAYAMTVHKSQGSEYRAVLLVTSGVPNMLMTRGILYTAVTRAKELLIAVGEDSIIERMIQNDRRQRRYSALRARLADGIDS